jgi:probable HAF family extracellular repeat protein
MRATHVRIAITVAVSLVPSVFAAPAYEVQIVPPVAGFDAVFPVAMESGVAIATAGTDRFDPLGVPVLWNGTDWVVLDSPGSSSFALGIGAADLVCGTSANEPVVWQAGQRIPLPAVEGMPGGFAHDAALSGVIVGSVLNDLFGTELPVVWESVDGPGSLLRIPRNAGIGTALAVNERGEIAGNAGGLPVIWPSSRRPPRRIATLAGGSGGELLDINEAGDAVGRTIFPDGTNEAMLWIARSRSVVGLGSFGGGFSIANALNDARQVVGTSSSPSGGRAFLWEAGQLHDLNALVVATNEPFLALIEAVRIDESGTIAAAALVDTAFGPQSRLAILTPTAP